MIPEMFATPARCHLFNAGMLSGAKQYLDCDLKKTNVSDFSWEIILWADTSEDISINVDSTITSFLDKEGYRPLFVAFMSAATEYNLEHHIKEFDATGLKQVKQRIEGFYRRNKETLGKCREIEKWFKE